ncbi:C-Jun-amino-terminal kinase-interacting 4-like [Schistosoma japonicum]|nr:C-Jun-amino-terminal kinase-interacting 4-like [Schistosoma japonicum]
MLWVGNVVHNLLPHIKMMARCCGWGNVVHNLLPHIKMMARCCGCKLIGGDELCMKKIGGNVVHNLLPHIKMMARCCGCGNVVHNLLPHIKMMARCCGVWECRAQPSSPYKDDGEMLWV